MTIPRRTITTLLALTGAALSASGQMLPAKSYEGYSVVRVTAEDSAEIESALQLAESIWSERAGVGRFEVVANAEQLASLQAAGLEPDPIIADLGPMIEAERVQINALLNAKNPWFASYHRTDEIHDYIDQLALAHPQLATLDDIGDSLQGRELKAIRITGPGDTSDRPIIFFNGGQHAREWISPATVTYIADQLLTNYGSDPLVTTLVDEIEWVILPVVNPDGYEYTWDSTRLWRKNRRNNGDGTFGVDLNRNWDIDFGGQGASSQTNSDIYHGPAAFSEPETAAIRDFIASEPRVVAHIDFHCFSQLILYPWGYSGAPPLPSDLLTFYEETSEAMSDAIRSQYGVNYTPQESIDLYPAAGVMSDWTASQGLFGWTVELRPATSGQGGFVLPPEQILPTGIENFEAVKVMASAVAFPFLIVPDPANPSFAEPGEQTTVRFDVLPQYGVQLAGAPTLLVREGDEGAFSSVPMSNAGGTIWEASLPASSACIELQYAVEASADDGRSQSAPFSLESELFSAEVIALLSSIRDDMETDTGWTVGSPNDDATTGIWSRSDPEGTGAQPENDASPDGTQAWITDGRAGSGLGTWDIDGGQTTLTSPALDATNTGGQSVAGEVRAFVSYERWYSNDTGNAPNADSMLVEISGDDGQSWTLLEEVTQNAGAWVPASFEVGAFVTPSDEVRLRFIASDFGDGSVVEAGIDELRVEVRACTGKLGDFADSSGFGPPDGIVDFGDFFWLSFRVGPCPGGQPGCLGDLADSGGFGPPDGQIDFGDFFALSFLVD